MRCWFSASLRHFLEFTSKIWLLSRTTTRLLLNASDFLSKLRNQKYEKKSSQGWQRKQVWLPLGILFSLGTCRWFAHVSTFTWLSTFTCRSFWFGSRWFSVRILLTFALTTFRICSHSRWIYRVIVNVVITLIIIFIICLYFRNYLCCNWHKSPLTDLMALSY